jgi:hypothetical protein
MGKQLEKKKRSPFVWRHPLKLIRRLGRRPSAGREEPADGCDDAIEVKVTHRGDAAPRDVVGSNVAGAPKQPRVARSDFFDNLLSVTASRRGRRRERAAEQPPGTHGDVHVAAM